MFNSNAMPSLSDIAAVTNNNDGFGDNNGWWILIILLALFGGWGYGGYGAGGAQGVSQNYVLASDFATIQRQLSDGFASQERKSDTINSGLCNGFYTEAQLINGLDKSAMQNTNSIMTQLNNMAANDQACCCATQNMINTGFADISYKLATDTCAINTNVANQIRSVIDNDNANYRAIDARLTAMEMSAKDDKIASLMADNQSLRLAASQEAQNNYIVGQLKQCPVPAYVVANPYVTPSTCCGCNA